MKTINMWHEARKQERLIRGMIVDYRRRAERRKDFYEKIKAEPTQFLQLHGRPCKIHLDPAVAMAGEGPAIMMPWQGDTNNMIDRFDVRAHLDYIPEVKNQDIPPEDLEPEERQCNYERYRILAQNAFLGISEDKFLQQLAIEEQFGVTMEEKEMQKEKLNEKKGTGVAIGYNYNDPTAQPSCSNGPEKKEEDNDSDDDDLDLDLEIIDVDLSIDVNKMEPLQAHELNAVGPLYGMAGCDLFSFLTGDADDAEHQKQLLREEKEKAMYSGRKSRRERRAHRDKKLASRVMSPPSYAAPSSEPVKSPSRSPSRSPSPDNGGNIEFITSFGGEEDEKTLTQKQSYSDKLKHNLKKVDSYSEVARKSKPWTSETQPRPLIGPRPPSKSQSRSRSRSRSKLSTSRSRSRSKSKSRSNSRSSRFRSKSRSRSSKSRSRSRSTSSSTSRSNSRRSRSRSHSRSNRVSRSPSNHGYAKRNDRRSMSYESTDKQSKPTVPRYYGRRKEDKSSSDLSVDSDSSESADERSQTSAYGNKSSNQNQLRLSGSSSKGRSSREALSLKEKLKRNMQAQLSRQLKADKRAEAERLERESRRQARRDEEMRELAIKLRRKQREMRHQQNRRSSDDSRSRSGSKSSGDSPARSRKTKSRSKSRSPEKPIQVLSPPPLPRTEYPNSRRKYPEEYNQDPRVQRPRDDRYDERYNPNRFDRFNYRNEDNRNHERNYDYRHDYHERFEDRGFRPQGFRRPFGHRGGFRGYRPSGPVNHGEGPSWRKDEENDANNSKKVKLVDY